MASFQHPLQYTIEKLWTLLKDLLKPEESRETRHLILSLFTCICKNQMEKNGVIRAKFFAFIQSHDIPEDSGPRFEFLKALTENGRDVSYFDEKIGDFLLSWMPNSQNRFVNTGECMLFIVNVIKFNQSFLDSDVLDGIIQ
jgi:tuberous sclerosis protein 2